MIATGSEGDPGLFDDFGEGNVGGFVNIRRDGRSPDIRNVGGMDDFESQTFEEELEEVLGLDLLPSHGASANSAGIIAFHLSVSLLAEHMSKYSEFE